jgi:hypothetical protein
MQVSSTLIAAQQAAREAATRLGVPRPGFAAALDSAVGEKPSFAPLPLRQTAAPAPAQPRATPAARLGAQLDITI